MILLALGVVLFAACHLTLAVPSLRESWRARLGKFYGPGLGLLSFLPLVLIVLGWRMAPLTPVYDAPFWGRIATFVLVFLGFLCLGMFFFRGSWRQKLRFPLALGIAFWAAGHLLSNGDAASLILFGGMLAYALGHLALGLANGVRPSPEIRQGHDVISLIMGAAFFGVAAQLHTVLTGVPVVSLSH
jgi:uncharacterized membrane protein